MRARTRARLTARMTLITCVILRVIHPRRFHTGENVQHQSLPKRNRIYVADSHHIGQHSVHIATTFIF